MRLIKQQLSEKLYNLILNWVKEEEQNRQHDVDDNDAWNKLIEYLMELEKDEVTS